jgi:hypothetical protein
VSALIVAATSSAARPTAGAPRAAAGEHPSSSRGGAAAASTRDAALHPGRVAPAPIRFLARTLVLALVFVGIHAAASHPLAALTVGAGIFIAACALASRR